MASFETQQKLIALGEQLVASLGAAHQLDMLSRWMAHYVAEQIQQAKAATGIKKARAEKQAFDTILALWAHRSQLPDGLRPFEGFEPILHLLGRLNPDNPSALYHRVSGLDGEGGDAVAKESEKTMWLDFVRRADHAARILVKMGLSNAAAHAVGASSEAILDLAEQAVNDDGDVAAIKTLLGRNLNSDANPSGKERIEQIERRIAELVAFREIAHRVETQLRDQSRKLQGSVGGVCMGEEESGRPISPSNPRRRRRRKRPAT